VSAALLPRLVNGARVMANDPRASIIDVTARGFRGFTICGFSIPDFEFH
jgi:hypothetical protein